MAPTTLLDTEELARALGVHPQTVRRWLRSDDPPPHYRPGGGFPKFDEAEVREWARADTDTKPAA